VCVEVKWVSEKVLMIFAQY